MHLMTVQSCCSVDMTHVFHQVYLPKFAVYLNFWLLFCNQEVLPSQTLAPQKFLSPVLKSFLRPETGQVLSCVVLNVFNVTLKVFCFVFQWQKLDRFFFFAIFHIALPPTDFKTAGKVHFFR